MWKLKVPSGGGKDGRTDGEASFCMARARRTTRGRRRAGAAEAVPGDFHNAVHIGLCDTNHMNVSSKVIITNQSLETALSVFVTLVIQT